MSRIAATVNPLATPEPSAAPQGPAKGPAVPKMPRNPRPVINTEPPLELRSQPGFKLKYDAGQIRQDPRTGQWVNVEIPRPQGAKDWMAKGLSSAATSGLGVLGSAIVFPRDLASAGVNFVTGGRYGDKDFNYTQMAARDAFTLPNLLMGKDIGWNFDGQPEEITDPNAPLAGMRQPGRGLLADHYDPLTGETVPSALRTRAVHHELAADQAYAEGRTADGVGHRAGQYFNNAAPWLIGAAAAGAVPGAGVAPTVGRGVATAVPVIAGETAGYPHGWRVNGQKPEDYAANLPRNQADPSAAASASPVPGQPTPPAGQPAPAAQPGTSTPAQPGQAQPAQAQPGQAPVGQAPAEAPTWMPQEQWMPPEQLQQHAQAMVKDPKLQTPDNIQKIYQSGAAQRVMNQFPGDPAKQQAEYRSLVDKAAKDGWDMNDYWEMAEKVTGVPADVAMADPDLATQFFSWAGKADGWHKLALLIGIPLAIGGIANMAFGGGAGSLIPALLGAGMAAYGGGMFDEGGMARGLMDRFMGTQTTAPTQPAGAQKPASLVVQAAEQQVQQSVQSLRTMAPPKDPKMAQLHTILASPMSSKRRWYFLQGVLAEDDTRAKLERADGRVGNVLSRFAGAEGQLGRAFWQQYHALEQIYGQQA